LRESQNLAPSRSRNAPNPFDEALAYAIERETAEIEEKHRE
jgi:hypothetical protein